jgi:hypothetical protein
MAKLPDFEGFAVFAKVAELRSFALAAKDLELWSPRSSPGWKRSSARGCSIAPRAV